MDTPRDIEAERRLGDAAALSITMGLTGVVILIFVGMLAGKAVALLALIGCFCLVASFIGTTTWLDERTLLRDSRKLHDLTGVDREQCYIDLKAVRR